MRFGLFVLCGIVSPSVASATTVRLLSEAEMTHTATVIVRGTVKSVTARYEREGLIVTDVTVAVSRLLKAATSTPTVTFTQLGGTMGDRTMAVPGMSKYAVGEEVVVFLEDSGAKLVEIAVGAGKYGVTHEGGRTLVSRRMQDLNFVKVEGKRATPTAPPPATGPEPLDTFEARILTYLDR